MNLNRLRKLAGVLTEDTQFFNNRVDVENWLKKYEAKNYTINDDLTVDVNSNVYLSCNNFTHFPVKFNRVSGSFYCHSCPQLTSLAGCPSEVSGNFDCFDCPKLTSLVGCPSEVGGDFDCRSCPQLTSLVGCPNEVSGSFYCHNCPQLKSLKGLPLNVAGTLCIDDKNKDDHYLQYCTYSELVK